MANINTTTETILTNDEFSSETIVINGETEITQLLKEADEMITFGNTDDLDIQKLGKILEELREDAPPNDDPWDMGELR